MDDSAYFMPMNIRSESQKKEGWLQSKGGQEDKAPSKAADSERERNRMASRRDNLDPNGGSFDITREAPTNEATDARRATKVAHLLEGITFPATKHAIKRHIADKSDSLHIDARNELDIIESRLDENSPFASSYEIEVSLGLVRPSKEGPYVRDRALNRANNKRLGEKIRPDPYEARIESVGIASRRDVSPNTPKGESL